MLFGPYEPSKSKKASETQNSKSQIKQIKSSSPSPQDSPQSKSPPKITQTFEVKVAPPKFANQSLIKNLSDIQLYEKLNSAEDRERIAKVLERYDKEKADQLKDKPRDANKEKNLAKNSSTKDLKKEAAGKKDSGKSPSPKQDLKKKAEEIKKTSVSPK